MNKLIFKILIFLLPVFIFVIALFSYNYDRNFAYHYIKDDCENRGAWIYSRIFENKKPVDIAFFGSSKTLHAVNDKQIENNLKQSGINTNCVNFGYCRFGNNLYLTFLTDLIETKKPKIILIEVRDNENYNSHPIFPFLAKNNEILNSALNKDYFSDLYKAMVSRYDLLKNYILNKNNNEYSDFSDFGYANCSIIADSSTLKTKFIETSKNYWHNLEMKFSEKYYHEIFKLCEKQNIKLYFYFIPSFSYPISTPSEIDMYKKYGTVLIPPLEIFKKPTNYMDKDHLNDNGSKLYSEWITNELAKY